MAYQPQVGGYSDIFIYMLPQAIFGVQLFGWGVLFRKINMCLGMKILWIFFGVITQLDYIK